MFKKILFSGFFIAIFLISCSEAPKEVQENDLGLIKASVSGDEGLWAEKPMYDTTAPGNSKRYGRAFENAPPMIPHNTEGFFPITAKKNICLTCHMPDKANAVKATQIPRTHFTQLRPELEFEGGLVTIKQPSDKLYSKDLGMNLNNAMFVCSSCHAPQAKVTVNIENRFTPEFRDELNKLRSTLNTQIKEGVEK